MSNSEEDTQRALFEVDLKEIEIVFAEGRVRMTTVATLTNVSATLYGVVAIVLATVIGGGNEPPLIYFLVIPLPFFLFAFLVLREDMVMVHNDFYLYRLRSRLLKRLGRYPSDVSLRFLPEIKSAKMGGIASVSTLLSVLRYALPMLVLVPCVSWFFWHAAWSVTPRGVINAFLLGINGTLLVALFLGILHLGALHKVNEKLVPTASADID